ncbi:TcfC E-set like domain-containing protein [Microbulbifer echini]|uniref:TcfC E-set like domain-containing protein n=1 Tax=Microbulbifer echini TaxID=1529067 RepID=A0ABV4NL50_9GAMM
MTIKFIKYFTYSFCILFVVSKSALAEIATKPPIETSIPSGFEDLSGPQITGADIYYGGQLIGVSEITVFPKYIEFNDPIAVFNLLPVTLDSERLKELLQQPQNKNTHRICHNLSQPDCGYLTPEDFAVIYDNDNYRLDVYFSPDLLPHQEAISDPYLPASSSKFSLVQNLGATWSGTKSEGIDNSYRATFNGTTIAGYGEGALRSDWHFSDEQGTQISSLHWAKDFRGKIYSAGLFQPQGNFGYFTPSQTIFGVEFRNSDHTRTDISHQQGALIEVNMPVRGRVEIYRENRLIHSELLSAGNKLLDTSNLPSGAYDIEIRTFDESGRPLTSFSEFFAKDFYLPAPGEWHWSLLAGMPTKSNSYSDLPNYYNEGLLQAYLGRRVSENIALFSAISATENQQLLELGTRWIGAQLELSPNVLIGSKGQHGYRIDARLRTPLFTLNASTADTNKEDSYDFSEYALLRNGLSYRSVGIQSQFYGGSLAFRYSKRNRTNIFYADTSSLENITRSNRKLATLSYQRTILKKNNWFGDITFSYNEADSEKYSSIDFQLRHQTNQWQHLANVRREFGDNPSNDPRRFSLDSKWNDRELWAAEVEQALGVESTKNGYYLESRSRLSGHQGFIHSSISLSDENNNRTTNYLGSFSTNLITAGKQFAWGGERSLESAIIVDIDGSKDKDFEVLVNNSRRGYAKGGKKSVINLPPFRSYDITLRPLDDGFYEYKEKSQFVTLYPGNVTEANYIIQPLYVIMGRLTSFGNGIPDTLVTIDSHRVTTDRFGVFQLEIPIDINGYSNLEVKWLNCSIDVQVEDSGENWINLGTLQQSDAYCLPPFKVSKK